MPESSRQSRQSKPKAASANAEVVLEDGREHLEAFVQANEAIMNSLASLNAEVLDFGNKRLRANIERSESLLGCEDAEEAYRIQWDFFQSATQQYLEQTNNVLAMMAKMNEEFWAPFEDFKLGALQESNRETRSSS